MSIPPQNWLLVRGLTREQRHWDGFEKHLMEAFPGDRFFFQDHPGFGTEANRPSPFSIGEIVEDHHQRFKKLAAEYDGPWNLISISLGGMVALEWTCRYPKDFKKAVLINSSVRGISPLFQRLRIKNIPVVLRIGFTRNPIQKELLALRMVTNHRQDLSELSEKYSKFHSERPYRLSAALAQLFAAATYQMRQASGVPTLVVRSLGDRMVHPNCSEDLSQKINALLVTHPTAGHDLPLDDALWVADQIKTWTVSHP